MCRHVFFTGEIGAGKSTALRNTLALLPGVRAAGLQTYYDEPRGADCKRLHLRAWGDTAQGCYLATLPGDDLSRIVPVFDTLGCELLARAQQDAELIVIDEIGRLEREAAAYHEALRRCIEGDVPVLCAIRKHKAPWADWIRSHPHVELIEVTDGNRDDVPALAAAKLARAQGYKMEDSHGYVRA